eukprot:gene196-4442_t
MEGNWIECCILVTFDLELGQKIEEIEPKEYSSNFTKSQLSDISYLSFPDSNTTNTVGSTNFNFRIQYKDDFLYGFVYFRQQRDSSIERGFLQKSIIILTKYPFIKLYSECCSIIGTEYFIKYELKKEFLFSKIMKDINEWDNIKLNKKYIFELFNKKIEYKTPIYLPNIYNRSLNIMKSNHPTDNLKKKKKNNEILKLKLSGSKETYLEDLNIYSIFKNNINFLIKIWELLILGESLLIISPFPKISSEACLISISIISPLIFNGDFRPYFTVHNTDFKNFIEKGKKFGFEKSTIIGVTNPFFIKSMEHWPHVLCLDGIENEKKKKKSSVPSILDLFNQSNQNSIEEKKKLLWEYKQMFWTKHNFKIKYDENSFENKLLKKDNLIENENIELTNEINDEIIRNYFKNLTNDFLFPLHQCFDKLWLEMKSYFIIRSEHTKIFKQEKFYNFVKNYGYKDIFNCKKNDVFEFYKKFIFSTNFQTWLHIRIREAYFNDVIHANFKEILNNASEVATIDLYLRIIDEIKIEKKIIDSNELIIQKLIEFLKFILLSLPISIRTSLINQNSKELFEEKDLKILLKE